MIDKTVAMIFVAFAFGIGIFLDENRAIEHVEGLVLLAFVYFLIAIYVMIENENRSPW